MKVAVIGGTGSFGQALAKRLASAATTSSSARATPERAAAAAAELGVAGATNADACRGADLVVLATKADATLETAARARDAIGDDAGPLGRRRARVHAERRASDPEATSIAARLQEVLDGPVVAGLHSLAARNLGADEAPEEDALVCGDDEDAKALVLELAERITAGRAIDCGPLASARSLEGLTAVIVNVNKRYKAHAGVRITGVR